MLKPLVTAINDFAVRTGIYLYFLIFFAGMLLLLSVIPPIGKGINSGGSAHLLGYAVLAFLTLLLLKAKRVRSPLLKAALFAGTYGLFIEAIQFLIPYRNFEVSDIIYNFSAAFIGVIPCYFLIINEWI